MVSGLPVLLLPLGGIEWRGSEHLGWATHGRGTGRKLPADCKLTRGQKVVTISPSTIGCEGGDRMADGCRRWRGVNCCGPGTINNVLIISGAI